MLVQQEYLVIALNRADFFAYENLMTEEHLLIAMPVSLASSLLSNLIFKRKIRSPKPTEFGWYAWHLAQNPLKVPTLLFI